MLRPLEKPPVSRGWSRVHVNWNSPSRQILCRPLILGSTVHHVSVPRSVADMHNSNITNIKKAILLLLKENRLQGSEY